MEGRADTVRSDTVELTTALNWVLKDFDIDNLDKSRVIRYPNKLAIEMANEIKRR